RQPGHDQLPARRCDLPRHHERLPDLRLRHGHQEPEVVLQRQPDELRLSTARGPFGNKGAACLRRWSRPVGPSGQLVSGSGSASSTPMIEVVEVVRLQKNRTLTSATTQGETSGKLNSYEFSYPATKA